MSQADVVILIAYLGAVVMLGLWLRRRASRDIDSYFLAGRRMSWWPLSMSGSVSTFDITGTMLIVSLFYKLGLKSMWFHWMWGFMMAAFLAAYMGKWIRRSNVLTGAEWMVTRFGADAGGQAARIAAALVAVVTMVAFVAYGASGIGKFASVYLPWNPQTCAIVIISVTSFYVILGGMEGVVITDVIQTVILCLGAVIITAIGFCQFDRAAVHSVVAPDWFSLSPVWTLDRLGRGDAHYLFGALVICWVSKGLLLNAGGPQQMYDFQRFLAARTPADAARAGAAWSFFLTWRWSLCMAICVLALVGFHDVTDPERVLPRVLKECLPAGLRGLVLAGLLAAFMSTFDSTINAGASYLVKDLYQPYCRPGAGRRELMWASYLASVVIVALGLGMMGAFGGRIETAFTWIMMILGAGVLMPNVLRWYWWRFNGWGYAAGTIAGVAAALLQLTFFSGQPEYVAFPVIALVGLAVSLVVTWLTSATADATLCRFYRTVMPGGHWRPVESKIRREKPDFKRGERFGPAVLNTLLGIVAVFSLYMAPIEFVLHRFGRLALWLALLTTAVVCLYHTWYRPLRASEAGSDG